MRLSSREDFTLTTNLEDITFEISKKSNTFCKGLLCSRTSFSFVVYPTRVGSITHGRCRRVPQLELFTRVEELAFPSHVIDCAPVEDLKFSPRESSREHSWQRE